jgi:hypothetical protein
LLLFDALLYLTFRTRFTIRSHIWSVILLFLFRSYSCFILLPAVLPVSLWQWWYLFFTLVYNICWWDMELIHFPTCSCSYSFAALWPHAYFQQLAETHSNGNANSINIRPTESEDEQEDHGGIALRDTSPILESMESGRRPWRSMPLWVCPRC